MRTSLAVTLVVCLALGAVVTFLTHSGLTGGTVSLLGLLLCTSMGDDGPSNGTRIFSFTHLLSLKLVPVPVAIHRDPRRR